MVTAQATLRLVIVFVLASLLSACASFVYCGDGRLRDNGPFEGLNRYIIDLGPIDLRDAGTYSYHLRNVPRIEMMVGFDVVLEDVRSVERPQRPITAVVALQLQAPDGSILVHETSPLNTWDWAERSDEPDIRFLWRSPSTVFQALADGNFTLTVQVIEPDTGSLHYRTRVAAKGGGWQQ
jgi:hypothetical protein